MTPSRPRTRRSGYYVLRDTGSGAYIDGPFKTAGAAQKRAHVWRIVGWLPVVIRAASRDEALRKVDEQLTKRKGTE